MTKVEYVINGAHYTAFNSKQQVLKEHVGDEYSKAILAFPVVHDLDIELSIATNFQDQISDHKSSVKFAEAPDLLAHFQHSNSNDESRLLLCKILPGERLNHVRACCWKHTIADNS